MVAVTWERRVLSSEGRYHGGALRADLTAVPALLSLSEAQPEQMTETETQA